MFSSSVSNQSNECINGCRILTTNSILLDEFTLCI